MKAVALYFLALVEIAFPKEIRFVKLADMDGDDKTDSIRVIVRDPGKCFAKAWRTEVLSNGNRIFSFQEDDWDDVPKRIPESDCVEYEKYVKDFHLSYLPQQLIRSPTSIRDGRPLYIHFKEIIRRDTPRFLIDSLKIDSVLAEKTIRELESRNANKKLYTLWLMSAPEGEYFPQAYSRVLVRFIPIQEW